MKNRNSIYFDHQATSPVNALVLQKMLPFFGDMFGNPHASDHVVGWESSQAVAESAAQIAAMIGADADEIIFTSGATEANNLALLGLAGYRTDKKRNRILVSAVEHTSILAAANILRDRSGYQVELLPVNSEGCVSVSSLHATLDETVLVVSIMAVNNEIGTIQDIQALARTSHAVGAVFHTDAAQAPVAMSLEGLANEISIMSLSAHKMGGPPGIGVLYVQRDLQERIEPLIYGGGQQNGLRSGTLPLPLCVGMGAAAEWFLTDQAAEARDKLRSQRDLFLQQLGKLPWEITVNGPSVDRRHPGNANVCFHGFEAHDILNTIQPFLAASTGSACTSGVSAPSHVLRAIGMSGEDAESSIRFSLGFSTSDEDVEEAVELIATALRRLSESEFAVSA